MSWVWDVLEVFQFGLRVAIAFVVAYAAAHPLQAAVAVLAVLRQLGTTVQTGSKGVLFVWGRVAQGAGAGLSPAGAGDDGRPQDAGPLDHAGTAPAAGDIHRRPGVRSAGQHRLPGGRPEAGVDGD